MARCRTAEQRERKNAYMRAWKRENKDKVNAINAAVKAKRPDAYREIDRRSAAKMRALDPVRFANKRHQYRSENPEKYLVKHAISRAAIKGVPFNLTETDVVVPEYCPVLGLKLEWSVGRRASANQCSPSLDRVVPALGYVKGNVRVISNRANNLKNNATLAELRALVAYVERETAHGHS